MCYSLQQRTDAPLLLLIPVLLELIIKLYLYKSKEEELIKKLNDESISYKCENYCIIISSSLLNKGENNINIVGIGEMKATLLNKEI